MLRFSDSSWRTSGVSSIIELKELAPMGEAFYRERDILPGRFNQAMWADTWWRLLSMPNFVMIKLSDEGGASRGAIGGLVTLDLNTGELIAVEQFWYVDNLARGKGLLLLTAFEAWATLQGAVRCIIGHVYDDDRGDAWKRLFAMKHYVPLEVHYYKELPSGARQA